MRGEMELKCLSTVKRAIFYKDDSPIRNPFTHNTFLEASDEEFQRERLLYTNKECNEFFFGLLESDRAEFENILRIATPNPNESLFPDFIFSTGFIEHFQITSSQTTRKGSEQTKKEKEFDRTVNREIETVKAEWNETPCFDKVRSKTWCFSNAKHSYEFLCNSFKNNWKHHMDSRNKYDGPKDIGIFLIEYPEYALSMVEDVYHCWIDGMSHGDMRENEEFKEYRLSRDKKMLNYIYEFKDAIKYVVFVNLKRVEIIRTDHIPYLIGLLPWDYVVYPFQVTTISTVQNISISSVPEQGGEPSDEA